MSRRPARFLAIMAALAFVLTPFLAEAAAGGNRSMGSRGARTQQAAPPTQTTPNAARPVERSATTPAQSQAQRPAQGMPAAQQQSWFQRNPFMTGLLGGMLGAGLIGALMGGGFNLGEGLAGFLGLALQVALFAGIAWLVLSFIRSRRAAAAAPAGAYAGAGSGPTPDAMARNREAIEAPQPVGAAGGGAGASPFAPQGGDEIGLLAGDFDAFEKRLVEVQAAWSNGDLAALKRVATPEMVGYFSEDLAANSSRGVENRVEDVKLDQGDLSEAWQEGATQFATVAMRWSAHDYDVALADGTIVSGSRETRREHTEVWTFMRTQGGDWILSAIQQV